MSIRVGISSLGRVCPVLGAGLGAHRSDKVREDSDERDGFASAKATPLGEILDAYPDIPRGAGTDTADPVGERRTSEDYSGKKWHDPTPASLLVVSRAHPPPTVRAFSEERKRKKGFRPAEPANLASLAAAGSPSAKPDLPARNSSRPAPTRPAPPKQLRLAALQRTGPPRRNSNFPLFRRRGKLERLPLLEEGELLPIGQLLAVAGRTTPLLSSTAQAAARLLDFFRSSAPRNRRTPRGRAARGTPSGAAAGLAIEQEACDRGWEDERLGGQSGNRRRAEDRETCGKAPQAEGAPERRARRGGRAPIGHDRERMGAVLPRRIPSTSLRTSSFNPTNVQLAIEIASRFSNLRRKEPHRALDPAKKARVRCRSVP
ncbi:hypothetical protein KM043_000357 [Ampulex compressa]|nr:hypothetical protein KM043_000357 [Ampulex compressa]